MRKNKLIILLILISSFKLYSNQDSILLSVNTNVSNDIINIQINVKNNLINDSILIPTSNWSLLIPEFEQNLTFNDSPNSGGYNMIHLYESDSGIEDLNNYWPYCSYPRFFPSFIVIKPKDTLTIRFDAVTKNLSINTIYKFLYLYVEINYISMKEIISDTVLNSYIKKYTNNFYYSHDYIIDTKNYIYQTRSKVNYRSENQEFIIDDDIRNRLCKLSQKYLRENIKVR